MAAEPGIYFAVDNDRIRIQATRRADLQVSRLTLHARRLAELEAATKKATGPERSLLPTVIGVVITPSYVGAQKLQRAIERIWVTKKRTDEDSGSWFALTHADVLATIKQCGTAFNLKGHGIGLNPRKPAGRRPAGEMSVTRYVPDPTMARAEKIIQMETLDRKKRAAQVRVEVKMSTLIGGLSRLGKIRDEHKQAAARLKTLHEQAQLGGARAVDYEAVKVDTSGSGENNIGEVGARARREYVTATNSLGASKADLVERVVIYGETVSQIAMGRGVGAGGAARARVTSEVVDAVEDLARHFGLYAGSGRDHVRVKSWADGPRPALIRSNPDPDQS